MKTFFIKLKKLLSAFGNIILFILTGKGSIADEMIDEDVLDYSGQGRDKYGR